MTARHPTIAEIDLNAFRHNLGQVRRRIGPHRGILAVVKANAYGHGIVSIAKAAASEGVQGLGVAFVEEGVFLRKAGLSLPILVMAGFLPDEARGLIEHHLTPVISHSSQLESLRRLSEGRDRSLRVHIKLDTGMGRLGISEHELASVLTEARSIPGIEIEGLMSHFADEGLAEPRMAMDQIRRFENAQRAVGSMGLKIPTLHMANSAAILHLDSAWFDAVRPGIMLYGYSSHSNGSPPVPLRPVMSLKSRIIHLKQVPTGTSLSYGRTFTTRRASRIAVLPIGYADGYSRSWSNRGRVLIGGRRVPVVGRVCMDMTLVDVTDLPSIAIGDEAILIGTQGSEFLGADELARELGTIAYEILCSIHPRVPRVYIGGDTPS